MTVRLSPYFVRFLLPNMSVWAPPQVVGPKVVVDPRPERQIFVGTGPLALHAEGHIDAEEELAVLKSIENGDAVGRALNVAPRQVYRRRSLLQDAAIERLHEDKRCCATLVPCLLRLPALRQCVARHRKHCGRDHPGRHRVRD